MFSYVKGVDIYLDNYLGALIGTGPASLINCAWYHAGSQIGYFDDSVADGAGSATLTNCVLYSSQNDITKNPISSLYQMLGDSWDINPVPSEGANVEDPLNWPVDRSYVWQRSPYFMDCFPVLTWMLPQIKITYDVDTLSQGVTGTFSMGSIVENYYINETFTIQETPEYVDLRADGYGVVAGWKMYKNREYVGIVSAGEVIYATEEITFKPNLIEYEHYNILGYFRNVSNDDFTLNTEAQDGFEVRVSGDKFVDKNTPLSYTIETFDTYSELKNYYSTSDLLLEITVPDGWKCLGVDVVQKGLQQPKPLTQQETYDFVIQRDSGYVGKNYLICLYFAKVSQNTLKYDNVDQYFYFEDGYWPQSAVITMQNGASFNETLSGYIGTSTCQVREIDGIGTGYYAKVNGFEYLGFVVLEDNDDDVADTKVLKLRNNNPTDTSATDGYQKFKNYTFTEGAVYWFRYEPIRWRVSDYGTAIDNPPTDWQNLGDGQVNKVVASDVLWYGAIQNEDMNALPEEYQQVEYIESTGTQYIDTGIVPNQDTSVYIDFQYLKNESTFIFGSRVSTSEKAYTLSSANANTEIVSAYYNSGNVVLAKFDQNRHVFQRNKNICIIDGMSVTSGTDTASFTAPGSIYLFACNQTNGPYLYSTSRIYACKFWQNETLVRDLIPCYRKSDGVIGLYDKVNGVFYTNAGTGAFLKGDDKNEYDSLIGATAFDTDISQKILNDTLIDSEMGYSFGCESSEIVVDKWSDSTNNQKVEQTSIYYDKGKSDTIVSARYIRINCNSGNTTNGSYHFIDLDVLLEDDTTITLIDAETETIGTIAVGNGSAGFNTYGWYWGVNDLTFDLGSVVKIKAIYMRRYYKDNRSYYGTHFKYSEDNSNWKYYWDSFNQGNYNNGIHDDTNLYQETEAGRWFYTTDNARIASIAEIQSYQNNLRSFASQLVCAMALKNQNQYFEYWTRDFGQQLGCGTYVTRSGVVNKNSYYTTQKGIRFSYQMTEGSNAGSLGEAKKNLYDLSNMSVSTTYGSLDTTTGEFNFERDNSSGTSVAYLNFFNNSSTKDDLIGGKKYLYVLNILEFESSTGSIAFSIASTQNTNVSRLGYRYLSVTEAKTYAFLLTAREDETVYWLSRDFINIYPGQSLKVKFTVELYEY